MNKFLFSRYACGIKWIHTCKSHYPAFELKVISRHTFNQLLMRLNLIIFFIAISFLKTTASVGQNISLSVKDAPLEQVLKAIKKQSGYGFWYEEKEIRKAVKVTLDIRKADLEEVLEKCFAGQPLTYSIVEQTIFVKPKESNLVERVIDFFQKIEVRGRIIDEKGEPLAGAYVTIKGTNHRTITKADGSFILPDVDEKALLLISYLGYQSKEITAKTDLGNITLVLVAANLKEFAIVSTGYQAIPKERATGSFVLVDSALINRKVGSNILDRLDGVTSGLIFTNNNNHQYNQANIQIRGMATLFANSEPLIVVDNFPYDGNLANINPNDVLSISVLKDAAAASAWGARSGNGVIVITTKKGSLNSRTSIDVNANLSISGKPDLYYRPQLSSAQFIEVEQFLFNKGAFWMINDGYSAISPAVDIFQKTKLGLITPADSLSRINTLKTYDSREQLLKYYYQPGINQQYQVNINGGSASQKFYLSAGYDKNRSNEVGHFNDRITLNASNTQYFLNNKLELSTNLLYSASNGTDGVSLANAHYPYDRLADENGNPLAVANTLSLAFVDAASANAQLLNWQYKPLDEVNNGYSTTKSKQSDYRLSLALNYDILPGFKASLLYSYQRGINESNNLNEVESYFTRNLINTYTQRNSQNETLTYPVPYGSILYSTTTNTMAHNGRFQLGYNKTWAKHAINAIAGTEIKDFNSFLSNAGYYGYNEETTSNLNSAIDYSRPYPYYYGYNSSTIPSNTSQLGTTDRYLSYYSNASYTYKGKYIASASARRDESNLFGVKTNQKGVPLWSAGLSWIINRESFYNLRWLPDLKFRTTYGYTGNIDNTLSAYLTAVNNQNIIQLYDAPHSSIVNPPNPSLRWEKVQNIDFGLDFSSKGGRINGSIDYWRKKGTDLIGNSPIAPQTGIALFKGNSANTIGQGLDVQINTVNLTGKLKWYTTLLYNYYSNKVTEYKVSNGSNYNVVASNYNNPLEGYPYYAIFSFKYAGLNATGNPIGYLNGDQSTNYSGIMNSVNRDELVYNGSATPTSFGGIRNDVSYKNFNLSLNIVYKLGYFFRRSSLVNSGIYSYAPGYAFADYENRWQKVGDENTTNVPALIYPANTNRDFLYRYADALIEKGDHIRLQDIRAGYTLQKKSFYGLSKLNFFTYVSNIGILWRANKYHIDPDYPTGIPTARTIAFGFKAGI